MRFPPHILDEIRARLPVSSIVGRRVTWDKRKSQPSRGDYWACCPFHNEKTPSFHCDDGRGHYHCFGCGKTGDVFRFLTEREGLSFAEAVEQLAAESGVQLPQPDPMEAQRSHERTSLADIVEQATVFYERNLRLPIGRNALAYARQRGFEERTLHDFRFGYAPDSRDALRRHLAEHGVADKDMAEAGLITLPDDGRAPYDRMRDRLIIPISDRRGRTIGFGGRTLSADREPKYLNSPESPLFQKRSVLFNLHRAREPAHRSGQIVVVEGYLDAIAAAQSGVEAVVAALGTAFTENQIRALWQLADEPILCFDGDTAGTAAAHRAIDRILPLVSAGKSFRFVFLPDGQDPDDLIKAGGRQAFLEHVSAGKPLHEVIWQREIAGARLDTPERRANLEQKLETLVASIADRRVARGYRFNFRIQLSDLFRAQDDRVSRPTQTASSKARAEGKPVGIEAPRLSSADDRLERALLGLSVQQPALFGMHLERVMAIAMPSPDLDRFRASLARVFEAADDEIGPPEFNNEGPEFFQTLHSVFGVSDADGGSGAALHNLLPVLAIAPPMQVVQSVYEGLLDRLELRDMRADYEREVVDIGDNLTEEANARLLAIHQDIQKKGEELDRLEQGLAESIRQIRKNASADFSR